MKRFGKHGEPRLNRSVFLLLVLCLLFSNNAFAQASAPATQTTPQQIAAKVDEYMQAVVRANNFTGSILVARNGQPIISKGYRMANFETGTPNTPQTKFRLGSVTKQFTAMAVMMLQEQGKLSVNDSICKYLADCPALWQPITIRNLLTHTSGIPSYTDFPNFMQTIGTRTAPSALVETFRNKPLEFAPGEKYKYNNSGYHLLGLVIERASGKSYADFLQENIFAPLAMRDTGYDSNQAIIKNRASGYAQQGDGLANALYIDMSIPFSAGALYSTTEDMLRWTRRSTPRNSFRKSHSTRFSRLSRMITVTVG